MCEAALSLFRTASRRLDRLAYIESKLMHIVNTLLMIYSILKTSRKIGIALFAGIADSFAFDVYNWRAKRARTGELVENFALPHMPVFDWSALRSYNREYTDD